MRPFAWRALAIALLVAAVLLAWLAFTRLGATSLTTDSPEEQRDFQRGQVRDAQLSAGLGVAASFSLLGTFACWQRAGRLGAMGAAGRPPEP